jgi:dsRNA-specific ribonuclease
MVDPRIDYPLPVVVEGLVEIFAEVFADFFAELVATFIVNTIWALIEHRLFGPQNPKAAKPLPLESYIALSDDTEDSHRRRVVWTRRFEETFSSSSIEMMEHQGGIILSFVLREILVQFPSTETERSAISEFLECDLTLHHFAVMYNMDDLLNSNLTCSAEDKKLLACYFRIALGALHEDKGTDVVKVFIYNLVRPIIEVNMSLDPVNTEAKTALEGRLGLMRCTLQYVEVCHALYPHTVLCIVQDEVTGRGHGLTFKDATLRAAMAALRKYE